MKNESVVPSRAMDALDKFSPSSPKNKLLQSGLYYDESA